MRIAMVSDPTVSDQDPQVTRLAAGLTGAGHRVTVYTRSDRETLPMGEFTEFLARRFRQRPPDLVHAHCWTAGLAALTAAGGTGAPLVQTYHGLGEAGGDRNTIERLLGRRASLVLAGADEERDRLVRMGVPRGRISVVPNGIDLRRFHPEGEVAARGARHRLLGLGRLRAADGFDRIIEVLPAVPDTELVLATPSGRSTVDEDGLRELARARGVADRVHLLGPVTARALPALLRSADALMCLPRNGSCGSQALAAMACGTAVITTEGGAAADTVVHGVTGLHVRPEDPRGLAKALRAFLADPAMVEACGAAGRDRVSARYSWDRVVADTDRSYERIVAATAIPQQRRGR
ncbi:MULTISPECIES: glycosyltransferase [unclassified Crossiella]|uniref:glycosyltransferase n=1 Tax=unclassified Crossiella TaxID=2620835 RepID=UPI001FFFF7DD|nr:MULTISPECIES: glycosyltransferase [unclassified Crossiella]MCK2243334.1 glycosyltransferase [Crossiella sp. S99.2]MCK2254197.1 glycosyltransferase [Crossiella sp. S99.1]